jgi:hypothetical protein
MIKKIKNPTKEQIQEYLGKIGWRLGCSGNFCYFYNQKNENTKISLQYPNGERRIVLEADGVPTFYFYLKDVEMELAGEELDGEPHFLFFKAIGRDVFIVCSK